MSVILAPLLLIFILFFILLPKNKKSPLSPHRTRYVLFLYLCILFVATFTVYILPTENLVQDSKGLTDEYSQSVQISSHLLDIAKEGKLESTPGIYQKSSCSFPVTDNQLKLELANDLAGEVFIERKDSEDGIIEVASYITLYMVNNVDITAKILPPLISMAENKLIIRQPQRYSLEFVSFKPDLTSLQFTKELADTRYNGSAHFGRSLVLLRVPGNIHIQTDKSTVINSLVEEI